MATQLTRLPFGGESKRSEETAAYPIRYQRDSSLTRFSAGSRKQFVLVRGASEQSIQSSFDWANSVPSYRNRPIYYQFRLHGACLLSVCGVRVSPFRPRAQIEIGTASG